MRKETQMNQAKWPRRSTRLAVVGLAIAGLLGLSACKEEQQVFHIGSKDFTESMILAEMMAALAEQEGIVVHRSIPYGTAATVFEALKQGKLDAYPEYNGTGLVFLGQAPLSDGDAALDRVRNLYRDLGVEWLDRFGFSNDYVMVMRPERAQALGISTISDLDRLGAVRFATDVTFTQRPLDGLGAMMRRYGLTQGESLAFALADDGKREIIRALLDDQVDVAEMFRTDPQIEEYGLLVLQDDLGFFPVYEASPLVRSEALDGFAGLRDALDRVDGKISAETMRALNAEVELNGRSAAAVALDHLIEAGLVEATASGAAVETLNVALGDLDSLSGPAGKAVRAARAAFPKRSIEIVNAPNPLDAVSSGEARLAVVGTEAFYNLEEERANLQSDAEALGVVGYRLVHLVTRPTGPQSLAEIKRLGVGQEGGASDRTARMIMRALDAEGAEIISGGSGDTKAQFEAMTKGLVDAILVLAPVGDKTVLELTESGRYSLLPIDGWTDSTAPLRFSFMRPAKIPANTYAGQPTAVETLSTQIVLAGPPSVREAFGAQGPGTTGTAATQPIPDDTVMALNAALGSTEVVDPAVAVAPALRPKLKEEPKPLVADAAVSIVNILVVAFLAWLIYLLFARSPRREIEG